MTDPRNIVKQPGHANIDEVIKVTYDNAVDELRQPSPRWDVAHGSGITDLKPEDVRWLRGRVVVELEPDVVSDVLVIPNAEDRDRRVGPAKVLGMGPPALDKRGREIPYGFDIGAKVWVVLPHKSRAIEMRCGGCEKCHGGLTAHERKLHVVAQSEVELYAAP